ncbi:uncharacterized protein LOC6572192 [Drosophila mojavensis]|uniref:CHK kinase-like domain-containing protein n=1 Tax=Drosophila mojavensis TaxID=7230 RepID=B4KD32_DROMO|nr:uncharacterized protein LOC6572192 [Drosophila mojavensis]EDW13802.1 uncharacterized protein Dmoj_GI23912 [Drosophila mojavensis]
MAPNTESYNQDELEAPSWLDSQYFRDVLSAHENDEQVEIIDVKISPATGKGDHYASVMFRAGVEYKRAQGEKSFKSLIIKTMPEQDGHKKDLLGESHIFETEINMYSKILPKFEQILREVGDETKLYAPCVYHSMKPRQVMIFEDLLVQGYTVLRDREPTFEEVRSAYCKLGKWHAVSYKLNKEQPEFLKELKYSLFELPKIDGDKFFLSGMGIFIEMLEAVPDLTAYKPYFEKILPNYMKRCRETFMGHRENPQENAYYVLCHGDFHVKNLMFRYNKEGGALEDCMLVDFQMSNVGPMPIDIIYSIYQMLSPEQRHSQRDELIYIYFSTFTETLKKINFNGELPTLAEFRRQIFQHKYFEFFLLATFLPVMHAMKKGKFEISEVVMDKNLRLSLYYNDDYLEDVRSTLKRYLHCGYFDELE